MANAATPADTSRFTNPREYPNDRSTSYSVVFTGIIDITSLLTFNMTTDSDAEKAKIKIDSTAKTATFTNVLLKSNENPANKAKINGTLAFIGSATAACGT